MASSASDVSDILGRLSEASARPRYSYLVLSLLSEVADARGKAGPYIVRGNAATPVRDWLCDALAPVAGRDHRRRRLTEQVKRELEPELPADPEQAQQMIDAAVRERIRAAGRPNISRAVSDLVRAGLVRRYYEGYRRNHHNRGAQRQAVYVVDGEALAAFRRGGLLV
jgi:hypothetical protein